MTDEGSEYMLSFEIGQREGGFYSARTHRITDEQTHRIMIRIIRYNKRIIYKRIIFVIRYNPYRISI